METAVLLYDEFAALDVVGPYEVFSRLPEAKVRFVAAEPGPLRTEVGPLTVNADHSLAEVPRPDIVVVPGGPGTAAMVNDAATLSWLRTAHRTATWTTSVCSGSLILAAAGLLEGRRAASHWLALDFLPAYGVEPAGDRVVVDGSVVTSAGVSAGIDMALRVAALSAGDTVAQAIQLMIEYAPQPPFGAGSPATAPDAVVEMLRDRRGDILRTGTTDLGAATAH